MGGFCFFFWPRSCVNLLSNNKFSKNVLRDWILRSSHQRSSLKKMFLKVSRSSKENICARVSFSINLQAWGLQHYQKGDFGAGVFLWALRNFWKHLFCRTPTGDCFWELDLFLPYMKLYSKIWNFYKSKTKTPEEERKFWIPFY